MQRYSNSVLDVNGNAVVGATVTVLLTSGATPTLYSDNGTTALASNTRTTDSSGEYFFYAANGRYNLTITAPGFTSDSALDALLFDPADAGADEIGYTSNEAGAADRTVAAKLQEVITPQDFGAVGDGETDCYSSFVAWLNALDIGSIDDQVVGASQRNKNGYIPAGVYYFGTNLDLSANSYSNKIVIRGAGANNTVLLFDTASGDAVSMLGFMGQIEDLSIYGTAARRAGTGNGLTINASLGTTSSQVTVRNVNIASHGGNGIELVRTECHTLDTVWVDDCGGRGIYLNHGAGASSWNVLSACRASDCDGVGIYLGSGSQHNTLTNCEALNNGGGTLEQIYVNGRSNILLNPDAEAVGIVTAGTSTVGIKLIGSYHKLIGGYIGDVNDGVYLSSATDCTVDTPTITNGTSGVTATNAVTEDSGSSRNFIRLASSFTNFTNALSPAAGRDGSILYQGGEFGRVGTWTPGVAFGGAAVGVTYSAQVGTYRAIGNLVYVDFDLTLTSNGSSTGSVTITGLPFTAKAGNRGMANVFFVSGGASLSPLVASAVSPGTHSINLRTQGAAGLGEISEANVTDTARIIGSCTYLK